jgi:nucleoside-diphosphate-sugar epimerase
MYVGGFAYQLMEAMMGKTVLVLGGKGRFARHSAEAFGSAGWVVRRASRKDDLVQAAQGADVIVMGWHPPTYDLWAEQMPALHARVQEAAKASGALVLVPSNVYVFGEGSGPLWAADTPHAATNPLGRLRAEVDASYARSGARAVILRAGDYIDPVPSGNWFDRFMAARLAKGVFRYPGRPDVPHAWAYLPDLARAAVALLEEPARYEGVTEVLFPGYSLTGGEMAEALGRVAGRKVALRAFPWWQLQLLRPVMPVLAGVFEMRYLWNTPHRLEGSALQALAPEFVPTPLDEALRAATAHLFAGRIRS